MKAKNLLKIDVNGVVSERRDIAKKELCVHFKAIVDVLKVPVEIIVTLDFDRTINKVLRGKFRGIYQYTSKREQVVATIKTIPYPIEDTIGFIIVFDGGVFGKWVDQQRFGRLLMFLHESTHVMDYVQLSKEIGVKAIFSDPIPVEGLMFALAHDIWTEYHAERFSIETLEKIIKEIDPKGFVTYDSHEEYTRGFLESLQDLPKFLTVRVNNYRRQKSDIDKAWRKVYLRLRETLILASYVTAQSDALNKTNVKIKEMKKKRQHFSFFKRWDTIHIHLNSLYQSKNEFNKDILIKIADEFFSLFKEWGITLSNVENGIYVKVTSTNF